MGSDIVIGGTLNTGQLVGFTRVLTDFVAMAITYNVTVIIKNSPARSCLPTLFK